MDWNKELYPVDEKPLDRLVEGYSNTSIFRTVAFIGDSLSSGEFEVLKPDGKKSYHDLFDYSWGQFMARKNGFKAYNFSKGGMSAKEYIDRFAEEKGYWSRDLACQAYVIALGVNDIYNQNMPVGSLEDINLNDWRNNKPTFLGYYAAIVSRYKEISPDAKFFFVTFPRPDTSAREAQAMDVIEKIYGLAEAFENAYVIDLFKYGPTYNGEFKEKFYLHNHLNPMGYVFTAKIIDSYIDYIIRHNPDDFRQVGFINSGIEYKF